MATKLNECLAVGQFPDWMTRGRTVLIQKDAKKEIFLATTSQQYVSLLENIDGYNCRRGIYIIGRKRTTIGGTKGCQKGSGGTNDLLFIDKKILREVKAKRKNIAMGCIDYRKAFDIVPHSWILECLQILKFLVMCHVY